MKIIRSGDPREGHDGTSRRDLLRLGALVAGGGAVAGLVAHSALAAENRNCTIFLRNTSGGPLTCTGVHLDWGKWVSEPPGQIADGAMVSMKAEGREGTATGTQGWVTYTFADNATSFTFHFDVPYSAANSGYVTLAGPAMSRYRAIETADDFVTPVSFPSHGDILFIYLAIGRT